MDPIASNIIMLNLEYFKSSICHQIAFQIQVMVNGKSIHHIINDEGASTCVMYLSYWRSIGSHDLN
jgi:predicted aspartyl protease